MIKHIVMWKIHDTAEGHSKAENMAEMKEKLLALKPLIPQIKTMQVGFDFSKSPNSYDFVLIVECENKEDLAVYANHPDHVAVKGFIAKVVYSRVVADFEE